MKTIIFLLGCLFGAVSLQVVVAKTKPRAAVAVSSPVQTPSIKPHSLWPAVSPQLRAPQLRVPVRASLRAALAPPDLGVMTPSPTIVPIPVFRAVLGRFGGSVTVHYDSLDPVSGTVSGGFDVEYAADGSEARIGGTVVESPVDPMIQQAISGAAGLFVQDGQKLYDAGAFHAFLR